MEERPEPKDDYVGENGRSPAADRMRPSITELPKKKLPKKTLFERIKERL